jgi:hypothetical protein
MQKRYTFKKTNSEMKTVSLKIDDSIFGETEAILKNLKKPRNRYINEALDFYNKFQKRKMIENQLKKESKLVRENSMEILAEFEIFENED